MVSKAEEIAGRCLRSVTNALADGDQIEESEDFEELQSALERFLPALLRETYPAQWRHAAFDGFRLAVARKTGPSEAELIGLGLLISDQTWTPFQIRLRAAPGIDGVSSVRCNVGDGGASGSGMTRLPYGASKVDKLLFSVSERPQDIAWAFSIVREALERAV